MTRRIDDDELRDLLGRMNIKGQWYPIPRQAARAILTELAESRYLMGDRIAESELAERMVRRERDAVLHLLRDMIEQYQGGIADRVTDQHTRGSTVALRLAILRLNEMWNGEESAVGEEKS